MNTKATTNWITTDAQTECIPADLGVVARRNHNDRTYALAYVELRETGRVVSIYVYEDDGYCLGTTERSSDWPTIEEYLPRREWPREIRAGKKAPAKHDATPDLRAILDQAIGTPPTAAN